jgi:predicted HicB family RNase H-like nuclease
MEYNGYTARVVFDEDAGVLFGEVDGLRDVVTFEATHTKHLAVAFRESVDDYLAMCAKRGEQPERPYSGKFLVRTDPGVHRDLAMAAARAGKSLNAYTSEVLKGWMVREVSGTYGNKPKTKTRRRSTNRS